MTTVTLSVASREDVTRRALATFGGEAQGAHISFTSVELLWQTLTKKRWEILKVMTGQGLPDDPGSCPPRGTGREGCPRRYSHSLESGHH